MITQGYVLSYHIKLWDIKSRYKEYHTGTKHSQITGPTDMRSHPVQEEI